MPTILLFLQASKTSKAKPQAKASNKKHVAAVKKKQTVLSSSAESEEEEEEEEKSSSEDETERLQIERVLDGRPSADSKQEEFLVKFKGDAPHSGTML